MKPSKPSNKERLKCKVIALNVEQLTDLTALMKKKFPGASVTCAGCALAQEQVVSGKAQCSVIGKEGHEKSPMNCLQACWNAMVQSKWMFKNGNIGRMAAKLTLDDKKAAQETLTAMSRASTAPGTPSYNPGEGEDDEEEVSDTQEGGSSSAAPRKAAPMVDPKAAAIEVEGADEMLVDEDADDMHVDEEPKKKRGRGRPRGSKNKHDKKAKKALKHVMKHVKVVARNDSELVAQISDGSIRLVYLVQFLRSHIQLTNSTYSFKLQEAALREVWCVSLGHRRHGLSAHPYPHLPSRSLFQGHRRTHAPRV